MSVNLTVNSRRGAHGYRVGPTNQPLPPLKPQPRRAIEQQQRQQQQQQHQQQQQPQQAEEHRRGAWRTCASRVPRRISSRPARTRGWRDSRSRGSSGALLLPRPPCFVRWVRASYRPLERRRTRTYTTHMDPGHCGGATRPTQPRRSSVAWRDSKLMPMRTRATPPCSSPSSAKLGGTTPRLSRRVLSPGALLLQMPSCESTSEPWQR